MTTTMRNLVLGLTLLVTATVTAVGLGRPASRSASPCLLGLQVSALVQREQPDGSWGQVARGGVRAGDGLQLTVQIDRPGHLLVAARTASSLQVLYPLPGQSGEVRAGWAYALPDPNRSYHLDGLGTRLLVLASRDPLPSGLEDRRAILRAAERRVAAPQAAPAVQLELRDGTPVSVEVGRYHGASPVLATLDLAADVRSTTDAGQR